jgi:hypothetical protein
LILKRHIQTLEGKLKFGQTMTLDVYFDKCLPLQFTTEPRATSFVLDQYQYG